MGKKHQKRLPEKATPAEGAELARREAGLPATRTAIARWTPDDLSSADKIHIDGLEVFANHGVYPEERALGQKFVVSLTLYTSLREAGRTDDLRSSIDYAKVCHRVDTFLCDHVYKLIEAVAEGLADDLLATFDTLMGVRVRLEKPWAPVGLPLRTIAVEIVRTR